MIPWSKNIIVDFNLFPLWLGKFPCQQTDLILKIKKDTPTIANGENTHNVQIEDTGFVPPGFIYTFTSSLLNMFIKFHTLQVCKIVVFFVLFIYFIYLRVFFMLISQDLAEKKHFDGQFLFFYPLLTFFFILLTFSGNDWCQGTIYI